MILGCDFVGTKTMFKKPEEPSIPETQSIAMKKEKMETVIDQLEPISPHRSLFSVELLFLSGF